MPSLTRTPRVSSSRSPWTRPTTASRSKSRASISASEPKSRTSISACEARARASVLDSGPTESHEVIGAIFAGEAHKLTVPVGFACINLSTSKATLSEIDDSNDFIRIIHKIQALGVSTLLLPSSSGDADAASSLRDSIHEKLPQVTVVNVPEGYLQPGRSGFELVQDLACRDGFDDIQAALLDRPSAVTAAFSVVCCAAPARGPTPSDTI